MGSEASSPLCLSAGCKSAQHPSFTAALLTGTCCQRVPGSATGFWVFWGWKSSSPAPTHWLWWLSWGWSIPVPSWPCLGPRGKGLGFWVVFVYFFVVRAGICVVCTPQEHRAAGEVLKLLYPRTASLSCSQAPPLMSRQELGRVVPSAGVGARGERNRCCVIRDGGEGERNPKFLAGTATPGTGSAKALTDPALSGKQGAAVREPCLNHAWFNQVNCFMGL